MKKQFDLSVKNILDKYDHQLLDIITADLRALKHLRIKNIDPAAGKCA
jgi:hypothetical protein